MNIKYRAAEDESGNLVYIENVNTENRKNRYLCASCHEEVIPILGNCREHHFRHLADHVCNGETYLHRLAKDVLKKRFDSSSEFKITFKQSHFCDLYKSCSYKGKSASCKEIELVTIDLKKHYDECKLELYDSSTQKKPDLTLLDSTGKCPPMWLEVFFTHRCTEEKLQIKNIRIIEFEIKNEEDALSLAHIDIKQNIDSDEETSNEHGVGIRFHKFKDEGNDYPLTKHEETEITRVALQHTGYIGIKRLSCREIDSLKEPQNYEMGAIRFIEKGVTSINKAKKHLALKGIGNYRSCYWCQNSYSPQPRCSFCSCHSEIEIKQETHAILPYHCGKYVFSNYSVPIEVFLKEGTTLEQIKRKTQQFPSTPALPVSFDKITFD